MIGIDRQLIIKGRLSEMSGIVQPLPGFEKDGIGAEANPGMTFVVKQTKCQEYL